MKGLRNCKIIIISNQLNYSRYFLPYNEKRATSAKIVKMNELLVLPKDKRISLFKIECESEILFSDWKPDGKVYTKQLILKNVSNSLLTLTYKLPTVACFFTPYPD